MPIKPARAINWRPPPQCPICSVGITASGQGMPFAVDVAGRVYCCDHGGTIEPSYPDKLREYEAWRFRRAKAIDALEEDVAPSVMALANEQGDTVYTQDTVVFEELQRHFTRAVVRKCSDAKQER